MIVLSWIKTQGLAHSKMVTQIKNSNQNANTQTRIGATGIKFIEMQRGDYEN